MLATAPRLLGHSVFSGLAVAWTATSLFGYGVAMPTEQLIARRISAADHNVTRGPARRLVAAALVSTIAVFVWTGWSATAAHFAYTRPALVLGIWGWTLAACGRGHVAGLSDLKHYAWLFGAEASARILLVAACIAFPTEAPILFALSPGVPILLAGALACIWTRSLPRDPGVRHTTAHEGRGEQLAFVFVALAYQVCLGGAPLVLDWRIGVSDPSAVGAFVVASSYFRLATVVAGGFATPALLGLTRAHARGDYRQFSAIFGKSVGGVAAVAGGASCAALLGAPVALPVLYGRPIDIGAGIAIAIAGSSVLATTATVAGSGLMALNRAGAAAVFWMTGAVCLVLLVSIDTEIGAGTVVGTVAGPGVALAGLLVVAIRTLRRCTREPALRTT